MVAALLILALACHVALYTELGVMLLGNRYWMMRAEHATTEEATRRYLRRVLEGTQYGVDNAKAGVKRVSDRQRRIELWEHLIELAPNDRWVRIYRFSLEEEQPLADGQNREREYSPSYGHGRLEWVKENARSCEVPDQRLGWSGSRPPWEVNR